LPKPDDARLTEQQRKWFASIREGLHRDTGRSLEDWVAIAKTCPESKPRARLKWFKEEHGLLQNRASYVLNEAFPPETAWSEPEALRDRLWRDMGSRQVFDAVSAAAEALPQVIVGQRKGFSAWSRRHQFAALRPAPGGGAILGLALDPDPAEALEPARSEGWSERLKSRLSIISALALPQGLEALLKAAWERS
jgi:hypothetical protein